MRVGQGFLYFAGPTRTMRLFYLKGYVADEQIKAPVKK